MLAGSRPTIWTTPAVLPTIRLYAEVDAWLTPLLGPLLIILYSSYAIKSEHHVDRQVCLFAVVSKFRLPKIQL